MSALVISQKRPHFDPEPVKKISPGSLRPEEEQAVFSLVVGKTDKTQSNSSHSAGPCCVHALAARIWAVGEEELSFVISPLKVVVGQLLTPPASSKQRWEKALEMSTS